MRRHTQYALACAVVLALIAGAAGTALAQPANPYVSQIKSDLPGVNFTNTLTATVTQNLNGSYHYAYKLDFVQSPFDGPLTDFSVGNPNHLAFSNPYCSDPRSYDPFDGSGESLYWYISDDAWPGTTVWFSFDSPYSYGLVNVAAGADYFPASGKTLGMVPEPGSVTVILLGLGAMWARRKRR